MIGNSLLIYVLLKCFINKAHNVTSHFKTGADMTAESFLSQKLQKFSIVDFGCVKIVYLVLGLLIFSLYMPLMGLSWWFYLVLAALCALPLYIHLFSQPGGMIEKMHRYLKTNNPSNQVLLFLSMFFFSLMLGALMPVLTSFHWWIYVTVMIIFALKPMTKTWLW